MTRPDRLVSSCAQFGPLFIHPAFYFGSKLFYRQQFQHSRMQQCVVQPRLFSSCGRDADSALRSQGRPRPRPPPLRQARARDALVRLLLHLPASSSSAVLTHSPTACTVSRRRRCRSSTCSRSAPSSPLAFSPSDRRSLETVPAQLGPLLGPLGRPPRRAAVRPVERRRQARRHRPGRQRVAVRLDRALGCAFLLSLDLLTHARTSISC